MMKFYYPLLMLFCWISLNNPLTAATLKTTVDDWQIVGPTQETTSPYNYYFYKLLQINASADRYASIIEVSVQSDANSYYVQGTYRIRVDKYEGTPNRFDGLEIQCSSGNPAAATFYIYNDALWVRSNYKWGNIYYRTDAQFGQNPLNMAPFGKTLTAPAGYATTTANGSIKCDFDNNKYTPLPVLDIVNGNATFYNKIWLVPNGQVGMGLGDQFAYDSTSQPHYGFQWTQDSWTTSGPTYWLSSYGGLKFFTGGTPKMVVTGSGNVGIGTTNPQAKLAVNGEIFGTRVKVTQAGWADFVFDEGYKLPGLAEVENYIKNNKHLPEIPSAAEVEKEGLDVGEMNKRLLQKVEELTLYIIQQDKSISELQEVSKEQNELLIKFQLEIDRLRTKLPR